MKKYILPLLTATIFISCQPQTTQEITNKADYAAYLNPEAQLSDSRSSTAFWLAKLKQEPAAFSFYQKLAGAKTNEFNDTGNVDLLADIDSLLLHANKYANNKTRASNYLALSSNAIKRHQFQKAFEYTREAAELTDRLFEPDLMQFDADMELGKFDAAEMVLNKNKSMESFDYLVRLSKFQDHQGDLDSAIHLMEAAYQMVQYSNSPTALWAQANLADMYGHAGELEKSYRNYLQVLDKEPSYTYALQGIAWIAYSNDKKVNVAREIYTQLKSQTALPDLYLNLSELCEYEGNIKEAQQYKTLFVEEASKPKYRDMYNKYLVEIYLEQGNLETALLLARREVQNRPTPMTYSLLASVYIKLGKTNKALWLVENQVAGKTYEPEVIYRLGKIYLDAGKETRAEYYLLEANAASYELGPVASREIESLLESI